MAFESLADKLQNVFKNLTGKGRLSEADVKAGLKEVKMALLEADVSFKVVKQFINSVPVSYTHLDVYKRQTYGNSHQSGQRSDSCVPRPFYLQIYACLLYTSRKRFLLLKRLKMAM